MSLEIHNLQVGFMSTNCYLAVNTGEHRLLIIDPGADAERIIRKADELEAEPAAILLTHGQFDPIMAVDAVRKHYEIPVYALKEEAEVLRDPAVNMSSRYGDEIVLDADGLLKDHETLTLAGLQVLCIHTPGHTRGGCCYYLPEEGVLFSGDTLFRGSVGRTDFPGGSTKELIDSVHRLINELPPETAVYPGHDLATTIGEEARYNPFV